MFLCALNCDAHAHVRYLKTILHYSRESNRTSGTPLLYPWSQIDRRTSNLFRNTGIGRWRLSREIPARPDDEVAVLGDETEHLHVEERPGEVRPRQAHFPAKESRSYYSDESPTSKVEIWLSTIKSSLFFLFLVWASFKFNCKALTKQRVRDWAPKPNKGIRSQTCLGLGGARCQSCRLPGFCRRHPLDDQGSKFHLWFNVSLLLEKEANHPLKITLRLLDKVTVGLAFLHRRHIEHHHDSIHQSMNQLFPKKLTQYTIVYTVSQKEIMHLKARRLATKDSSHITLVSSAAFHGLVLQHDVWDFKDFNRQGNMLICTNSF